MDYRVPLVLTPQPEGGYTVTSPLFPELITEGDSHRTMALDPISQQATVIPDWGNARYLSYMGTISCCARQLGIDWQRFLDA